ncbi:MAG TPA: putative metal-dependent hydrolase [Terriglobales bacterium]|nr:putative metal-dependent hydrolase [Terriglobales bacterium]
MKADLRYPIGKFNGQPPGDDAERQKFLKDVEETPARLRTAMEGLSEKQIDTPYREGGWTVRQVVHHVTDSHLNSYIRFKWALTEDEPTIKTYYEDRWAELPDSKMPVQVSLALLDSLHQRWINLLSSFKADDWKKTLRHPELGLMTLDKLLALYAWHGKHHVAHITGLRERMGW